MEIDPQVFIPIFMFVDIPDTSSLQQPLPNSLSCYQAVASIMFYASVESYVGASHLLCMTIETKTKSWQSAPEKWIVSVCVVSYTPPRPRLFGS